MPYAGFSPIIGSGFDQLAAQQAGWAGFNNQVDSANLARLTQAQQTANQYWRDVAAMQQNEAARQDRLGLLSAEEQNRQAQTAEGRRQFDVNVQLEKARQGLEAKRYQFATDEKTRQEELAAKEIENAGNALAPQYSRVAEAMAEASRKWNEAQQHINSIGHELLGVDLAGIPNIRYDDKTMTFMPALHGLSLTSLPADQQQKIAAAQSKVDAAKTDKQQVALEYQDATHQFKFIQDAAAKYGFIPQQDEKGNWSLYSAHPKINRAFTGGRRKAATDTQTSDLPTIPQLPEWARPPSPDELNVGNALTSAVSRNSLAGGVSALPGPYQFSPTTETASSLAAAPPASPPAPLPAPSYGFARQRALPMLVNPQFYAGLGRAANYWAGDIQPGETSRGLGGTVRAMIGDPNKWLPSVPAGRVRVISPDGRVGTIPIEQQQAALASGYRLA